MLTILIRDFSMAVVGAVREAAARHHGDLVALDIAGGDALAETADAIVSPADSFAFMDGGIQGRYALCRTVGTALCVPTKDAAIRHVIAAPMMRVPLLVVDLKVVFLATRAAVRCALDHGFASLILPGMGTGVGRLKPDLAARQMVEGVNEALRPPPLPIGWWEARTRHFARQA